MLYWTINCNINMLRGLCMGHNYKYWFHAWTMKTLAFLGNPIWIQFYKCHKEDSFLIFLIVTNIQGNQTRRSQIDTSSVYYLTQICQLCHALYGNLGGVLSVDIISGWLWQTQYGTRLDISTPQLNFASLTFITMTFVLKSMTYLL